MSNADGFTFEISLSVLNHLGRNLYRNFVTVLGEAISNSWDADAKNVWIYIDREKSELVIKDDGVGMTSADFSGKFLKVGYSKRGNNDELTASPGGRPFIGRKGIGKLALLSCAKKISIISKTSSTNYIGGTIDNSNLDEAISEDSTHYDLEGTDSIDFSQYTSGHEHGTIIFFKDINDGIKKSEEYLRKILALYFRFSLIDSSFKVHLNGIEITEHDLQSLAQSTQFLWNINTLEDPYIKEELTSLKKSDVIVADGINIRGFIASVEKPRNLEIVNTEEKTGIDLFVNGRLREKNILKHLSAFSTRHVASYLYGQIHFDELDGPGEDRFTTSREGIKDGNDKFESLLTHLKDILEKISDDWDKWRLENKEEGDDENPRKSKKDRRARSLYDLTSAEYETPDTHTETHNWIDELRPDAEFNIPAYVECFLSENLLRKKIETDQTVPASCLNVDLNGHTCEDRYNPQAGRSSLCEYCKGAKGKASLQQQKVDAGTSIQIRDNEESVLLYLDYIDLAKIINNEILREEDKPYKPLRNSVMHTSRLTAEAKTKLTSIFDNVVATVKQLIGAGSGRTS